MLTSTMSIPKLELPSFDSWKDRKNTLLFERRISCKWRIEKPYGFFSPIQSPPFKFLSSEWYLTLKSSSIFRPYEKELILLAWVRNPVPESEVKLKMCIKDKDGADQFIKEYVNVINAMNPNNVVGGLLTHQNDLQEMRTQLLQGDVLTIHCELTGWENDRSLQCVDQLTATKSFRLDCSSSEGNLASPVPSSFPEKKATPSSSFKSDTAPPVVVSKGAEILQNDLEALLRERKNCDVSIQVGLETFHAHRCILAARSSVFDAMFQHDMQENRSNIITVTDIEPDVMSSVLAYIYSGKVNENSVEKSLGLYVAADKYALKELKTQCADLLRRNLSVNNFFDIATIADAHNDGMIIDSLKKFIGENTSFLSDEKWKHLVKQCPDLASEIILALSQKLSTKH